MSWTESVKKIMMRLIHKTTGSYTMSINLYPQCDIELRHLFPQS